MAYLAYGATSHAYRLIGTPWVMWSLLPWPPSLSQDAFFRYPFQIVSTRKSRRQSLFQIALFRHRTHDGVVRRVLRHGSRFYSRFQDTFNNEYTYSRRRTKGILIEHMCMTQYSWLFRFNFYSFTWQQRCRGYILKCRKGCPGYCELRKEYWLIGVIVKHKLYGHRDELQNNCNIASSSCRSFKKKKNGKINLLHVAVPKQQ